MVESLGKSAVLIAGPTASGKSSVALEVAQALDGVIINADAMQIYADLRVLTSRPGVEDERSVPHRLYGTVPGEEAWSAGRWLEAASAEIRAAWADGKTPVIAGGTGLYFKALELGLSPIPAIAEDIRARLRGQLIAEGAEALHEELARRAPGEAERLERGDGQRIVRALEVLEATGKPLAEHFKQAKEASVLSGADVRKLALMPPREALYAACDARFEAMLDEGALEEVQALMEKQLAPDLPVMKAIGVRPLADMLAGQMSREDAIELCQRQTRNYAKRQMTWIRNQMADWPRFESRAAAIESLLDG